MIELFLNHNADPNICNRCDKAPFHCICKNDNVTLEIIELFLNHNADPNKCDGCDKAPFH